MAPTVGAISSLQRQLTELSRHGPRTFTREPVMKTYFNSRAFNHRASTVWALLAIPMVALAYPVVTLVVPAILHAVVPESVRAVLSML
jgi:hypothetical protein